MHELTHIVFPFLVQTLCLRQSQERSTPSRCNTRRSDTQGHAELDVFHKRSRVGCSNTCVGCLRSTHWCGDGNAVNEGFLSRNCWCCGADAGNVVSPLILSYMRTASLLRNHWCGQLRCGIFVANKLALEAGIGCRLLLKNPAITWLVRHVGWLMTRYNTGRDGRSLFRRIFGKPYEGSICKFGEQVHYKLSGRPSSRVEPRWELEADGETFTRDSWHPKQQNDLSIAKESPLQQRCIGSHLWHSNESQT